MRNKKGELVAANRNAEALNEFFSSVFTIIRPPASLKSLILCMGVGGVKSLPL